MSGIKLCFAVLFLSFHQFAFPSSNVPRVFDIDNFIEKEEPKYSPSRVAVIQYTADANFLDSIAIEDKDPTPDQIHRARAAQENQKRSNQNKLEKYARRAAALGARVIVLPEGSSVGYESLPHSNPTKKSRTKTWCHPSVQPLTNAFRKHVFCVDPSHVAEELGTGETTRAWQQAASDLSQQYGEEVYILFHIIEKLSRSEAEGLSRNHQIELYEDYIEAELGFSGQSLATSQVVYASTAVVVGPSGVVAFHRKTQRWQNEHYLASARGLVATSFDTKYGKFGISICLGFITDSIFETYRKEGVNAVLFPADYSPNNGKGWVGQSDHSFDFISARHQVDLFAADDGESSRTGIYFYDKKTGSVQTVIELHQKDSAGNLQQIKDDAIVISNIGY